MTEVEVKPADEAAEVLAKGHKRCRVPHTTFIAGYAMKLKLWFLFLIKGFNSGDNAYFRPSLNWSILLIQCATVEL